MRATREELAKNLAVTTLTSGRSLELAAPTFNDLAWSGLDVPHFATSQLPVLRHFIAHRLRQLAGLGFLLQVIPADREHLFTNRQ